VRNRATPDGTRRKPDANPRSATVIYTGLYSYLLGWVVTSMGLALAVRKLHDPVRPPSHPTPIVVAAGAVWPLVVLGAAQMATVALVVDVARSWTSHSRSIREHGRAPAGNELDELLNEPSSDAHFPVGT
jgi:hypothetical protein